jgi:hypothetical protein
LSTPNVRKRIVKTDTYEYRLSSVQLAVVWVGV